MASALDLPAASGVIAGTDKYPAGTIVNIRGFSLRAGSSAVSVNIREVSSTGQIVLYLGPVTSASFGDVFPVAICAKAPLYCEFVSGAAAGLGNVFVA